MNGYRGAVVSGNGRSVALEVVRRNRLGLERRARVPLIVDTVSLAGVRGRVLGHDRLLRHGDECTMLFGGLRCTSVARSVSRTAEDFWSVRIDFLCLHRSAARAVLDWMLVE